MSSVVSDDIWDLIGGSLRNHGGQIAWIRRLPAGRREVCRFDELYRAALDLAARLRVRGVGRGDVVGIMAPNGPEWGAAALAVWKLGAIVAPIHIGNSPADIEAQVRALAPRLVLVHDAEHQLAQTCPIELGSDPERVRDEEAVSANGLSVEEAARIYTSGSTGNPKIVCLSHRNISSNFRAAANIIHIGPNDRFLSLLPLSHALEMTCGMLLPLYCGATIVVPRVLAASEIIHAMAEENISIIIAVPRLFRNLMLGLDKRMAEAGPLMRAYVRLLRHAPLALRRTLNLPLRRRFGGRIKAWVSGGSRLDPEISRYFQGLGLPLRQGYGLTETGPVVSIQEEFPRRADSVGKPLAGVEVRVENPDSTGSGELWVRGPNVMLGYLDAAQTREVIEDGWFRTGDLARLDADGLITLTGRVKRVIVTEAGKNVYPEELESLLERFGAVKEAGVLEVDERPAVVLAMDAPDPEKAAHEVLSAFNARVSAHNRITRFAVVDELPRTPLGKIALKMLPEIFREHEVTRTS